MQQPHRSKNSQKALLLAIGLLLCSYPACANQLKKGLRKASAQPQGSPMADSPAPDVHFEARSANARTRRAATRVIHASRLRSLSGLSIGPIGEDRKVLSNEVRTEEVRQDHALQPHIPPPLVSKEACEIPLRCLIRQGLSVS